MDTRIMGAVSQSPNPISKDLETWSLGEFAFFEWRSFIILLKYIFDNWNNVLQRSARKRRRNLRLQEPKRQAKGSGLFDLDKLLN